MGIEELEKYINSLIPFNTFGDFSQDRIWASKSELMYFVEQLKQSLSAEQEMKTTEQFCDHHSCGSQRRIEELKKLIDYLRVQGPGKQKSLDMIEVRLNEMSRKVEESLPPKQEITEQQALNKLAERFPMTTDQIVSTLEMKVAHVEQEKTVVPEFVAEWIELCKRNATLAECLDGTYPLSGGKWEIISVDEDWIITGNNEELLARAWLDGYTVAKEPLYYVPVPHLSEVYYTQDESGVLDVSYGIGDEFTIKQIKRLFPSLVETAVPVEEEAE